MMWLLKFWTCFNKFSTTISACSEWSLWLFYTCITTFSTDVLMTPVMWKAPHTSCYFFINIWPPILAGSNEIQIYRFVNLLLIILSHPVSLILQYDELTSWILALRNIQSTLISLSCTIEGTKLTFINSLRCFEPCLFLLIHLDKRDSSCC